jgi:hypothetical protein
LTFCPGKCHDNTSQTEKTPNEREIRQAMKTSISEKHSLLIALLALLAASPRSNANVLVVGVGGAGNNIPFNLSDSFISSSRYQQFYDASQFGPMAGGAWITGIALRVQSPTPAFSSVLPDIQLDLSTSPKTLSTLSRTYASNVGADDITVFTRGPLTLSSLGSTGAEPTFVPIEFAHPFFYNPAQGGLLLDVRNFGGGQSRMFDADALPSSIMNRVYNYSGNANSTSADVIGLNYAGLVTEFRFTPVPEPTTLALLALGVFSLAFRRR